ncbi:MAG: three-Cys-motif partner protein TcmP [Aureispira sp.]
MASTIGFSSPQNALQVRCNLLGQYFMAWAKQTSMHIAMEELEEKFAYIDLAAGAFTAIPEDSPSYAILEWASRQRNIRTQLYPLLNDGDAEQATTWQHCLHQLPRLEHFTFAPQVYQTTVDKTLQATIATVRSLPTLVSADWCANTGLSWDWLRDLVQLHPADCLLWVNYKQLLAWTKRKRDQEQLERTLGQQASHALKAAFKKRLSPAQKADYWKQLLEERLQKVVGGQLGLLCYTFYDEQDKTEQFLYFLTQNPVAYTRMRQIMHSESQLIEDGIGNLCYQPSQGARKAMCSPTLFGPMFELEQHLLGTYLHQTIQLIDLYEAQHWGRSLTKKNYIDALLNLEEKGQLKITRKRPPRGRVHPKGHLPDKTFLSFKPQ